jgi:Ca-activated chloride channel family protein
MHSSAHVPALAAGLALAVGVGAALSATQDQQPTFRSGARTVAVYATVTGKDGRLVPDLGREAFEVKDSGKVRPITVFSNEVQPISVVLMLDRSGSMRGNFGLVDQAARQFIQRLRPDDTARLGVFGDRIEIEPEGFTSDHNALLRVLQSDLPVSGPTPLWNALDEAIEAVSSQEGRKVVFVFSDGGDAPQNFSVRNRSFMDVMRRAQQQDVMVYAVGLQTTSLRGPGGGGFGSVGSLSSSRPDPGLAAIADETGGGYFELTRADDLASTFAQVAEELHHQYAIGFEPLALDGKMHKLDVRVSEKGTKVRARQEYYAKKPGE